MVEPSTDPPIATLPFEALTDALRSFGLQYFLILTFSERLTVIEDLLTEPQIATLPPVASTVSESADDEAVLEFAVPGR